MAHLEDGAPNHPEPNRKPPILAYSVDEAIKKFTFKGPLVKMQLTVPIEKTLEYLALERMRHIELRDAIYLKLWYLTSIFNSRMYRSIIVGTRVYNTRTAPNWFARMYRLITGREKHEPITLLIDKPSLGMLQDYVLSNALGLVLSARADDEQRPAWSDVGLNPSMLSEESYKAALNVIFPNTSERHAQLCYAAYVIINTPTADALLANAEICLLGASRLGGEIDNNLKNEAALLTGLAAQKKDRPGVDTKLFKHTLVVHVPNDMVGLDHDTILATIDANQTGLSDALLAEQLGDLDMVQTLQHKEIELTMREYEKSAGQVKA